MFGSNNFKKVNQLTSTPQVGQNKLTQKSRSTMHKPDLKVNSVNIQRKQKLSTVNESNSESGESDTFKSGPLLSPISCRTAQGPDNGADADLPNCGQQQPLASQSNKSYNRKEIEKFLRDSEHQQMLKENGLCK